MEPTTDDLALRILNMLLIEMAVLLLQLENKHQIKKNNVETQHNHMYSLYIDSLCNIVFPMARFKCIMSSQVFVKIRMQ